MNPVSFFQAQQGMEALNKVFLYNTGIWPCVEIVTQELAEPLKPYLAPENVYPEVKAFSYVAAHIFCSIRFFFMVEKAAFLLHSYLGTDNPHRVAFTNALQLVGIPHLAVTPLLFVLEFLLPNIIHPLAYTDEQNLAYFRSFSQPVYLAYSYFFWFDFLLSLC